MSDVTWAAIPTPDGRVLDAFSAGPDDGRAFVFQSGTPTAAVPHEATIAAAAARGLRLIGYSRPGYASSTPQPGRTVAAAAVDVVTVLDAFGQSDFVTAGWSGGGPHALACAALLPQRCRAVATIAGVAPYPADGLDWLAGMGEENVEEFGAAIAGVEPLTGWLETAGAELGTVGPEDVSAALGDVVGDVDRASLTGDFAEWTATVFRKALSTGIAGWRDDDLAFTRPWGFELADIKVPVAIWQGGQDRMVPFEHGRWLAAHVPGATAHLLPDEGHLSLAVAAMDRILDELVAAAK